jgi:hypothetical protein
MGAAGKLERCIRALSRELKVWGYLFGFSRRVLGDIIKGFSPLNGCVSGSGEAEGLHTQAANVPARGSLSLGLKPYGIWFLNRRNYITDRWGDILG